jgi:hypothetical protein
MVLWNIGTRTSVLSWSEVPRYAVDRPRGLPGVAPCVRFMGPSVQSLGLAAEAGLGHERPGRLPYACDQSHELDPGSVPGVGLRVVGAQQSSARW